MHDVAQCIDDYDNLKIAFRQQLYPYVADSKRKQEDIDKDIQKEFKAQAKFLENSKKKLKHQLDQMKALHDQDNSQIMQANIGLIEDVDTLRNEVNRQKNLFNEEGGIKELKKVQEAKDKLAQAEQEQQEVRHADPNENIIEPTDGVDNSIYR